MVQDCSILKDWFVSCTFGCVRRKRNRAPHDGAKKALSHGLSHVWNSVLPSLNSSFSHDLSCVWNSVLSSLDSSLSYA
ncbi:hypothetical protein RHMOL_Rhmol02G0282700 [Rhododendron molle]|uniref:Uncharacterized protein n=1 Tax=Rhododendron molle TaxID=49168 RepID=A0ACC0PVH1_RHOML|nr:hypothetical protein RHMOL_Rhmol02G0282700 [Rhododendron molle]